MAGDALQVDTVEASYGATKVLKGISIEAAPGNFIALLGSSGCGKTTLLRAISGFVSVDSGAIRVGGRNITHVPPEKRGMAMVFQSYALWPHMTAARNIGYGLKLRGIPRADTARRVEEILDLLGLQGLGERNVTQLSGGQRQRVALGRALAVSPGILLLDEPLSNLDARIRQRVRHEIKAIQHQLGITAIHVTHDREEAMVMADRIAIMDAGLLVQFGSPEEVYNRPASPFVAAFMGADNVIRVNASAGEENIDVAEGPNSARARLPTGEGGAHVGGRIDGPTVAHFRREAARLGPSETDPGDALVLRGRITQHSYPGGVHRYAVEVNGQTYMVDDERRLTVGDAVGIRLPPEALHLYPEQVPPPAAAAEPDGEQRPA